MKKSVVAAAVVLGFPLAALGQAGPTQTRDGLPLSETAGQPSNSMPAGSANAQTGPQSRPAYPSGSTTANPGAAFVRDTPVPSTGPIATPPGSISTTTIGPAGSTQDKGAVAVGQAATPPK